MSDTLHHEQYMDRCLQLAQLGQGRTGTNPMVGSVLVHEGVVIGEGYHEQYGQAHAEVNCLYSVKADHLPLIERSTLYVSLEPCAHFGKTPPCADLIIEKRIPKVVIGCRDPFPLVDGKGIEKLQGAGVEVILGVREDLCRELNKRFFTFHTKHRPYIVLKWAQTADGSIANGNYRRLRISNPMTNRLVHCWRSEEMAILVGTNTALFDDPELTTRLWPGPNPVRLVVDMGLRLPASLKLFDGQHRTIVFNKLRHSEHFNLLYYQVSEDASLVHQLLDVLYGLKIQSVLVEGGAALLQTFIDEGMWDEVRVITNEERSVVSGLPAPRIREAQIKYTEDIASDRIRYYTHTQPGT
jgi:diaminohydroxyphosphoribosylaminopyrimidine deaminase / 5-amino-6-(5-phosphoribosylamino)uracil reductase